MTSCVSCNTSRKHTPLDLTLGELSGPERRRVQARITLQVGKPIDRLAGARLYTLVVHLGEASQIPKKADGGYCAPTTWAGEVPF